MKKILLTTTETLQGWEIESYLRPVFSNVVVGAGFLSDFSAGLTDFFGGRSNSYEKKLQAVNDSALQIIQSKASELGANCVIGLKVNVHQISGKNVQMFMVSAYGTPIVAKNVANSKTTHSLKEIDKSTVVDKAILIGLLEEFKMPNHALTMPDLRLIVDSRSPGFKDYIFQKLKKYATNAYGSEDEVHKQAEQLFYEYFASIEPVHAIQVLYDALIRETDVRLINKILNIIKTFDLVDYNYALKVLNEETLYKKKLALTILSFDKPAYVLEDVNELINVVKKLEASFPNLSNLSTKKGFLSSNQKDVWVCTCGKANPINENYCYACGNDQYGFQSEELKPATLIAGLNNKVSALNSIFESVNN